MYVAPDTSNDYHKKIYVLMMSFNGSM